MPGTRVARVVMIIVAIAVSLGLILSAFAYPT